MRKSKSELPYRSDFQGSSRMGTSKSELPYRSGFQGSTISGEAVPQYESWMARRRSKRCSLVTLNANSDPSRESAKRFLNSIPCQLATVLCILLNTVVIGMETDMPDLKLWFYVENGFLVIFAAELALRFYIFGPNKLFCCQADENLGQEVSFSTRRRPDTSNYVEIGWNIFDVAIVAFGFSSVVLEMFCGEAESKESPTLFRIMKLLRLARLLRLLRVIRFLKELYLLAYGFMEGAAAVFWVAVMAGSAIYLCAVILVRCYGNLDEDEQNYEFFAIRFSSVPQAMFSLFEIMSSPTLSSYREPLESHPALIVFIIFFVLFGSFGMNGLLTGVITEHIIDKNQARIEDQREEREAQYRLLEEGSGELFDEIDVDDVGSVDHAALLAHQADIRELFLSGGLDFAVYDVEEMFKVVDVTGCGSMTRSEFIQCLLGLCELKPLSIMEICSQVRRCQLDIEACHAAANQRHDSLMHELKTGRQTAWTSSDGLSSPKAGPEQANRCNSEELQSKSGTSPAVQRWLGSNSESASSLICQSSGDANALCVAIMETQAAVTQRLAELARLQEVLRESAQSGGAQASICLVALGRGLAGLSTTNAEALCEFLFRDDSVNASCPLPLASSVSSLAADLSCHQEPLTELRMRAFSSEPGDLGQAAPAEQLAPSAHTGSPSRCELGKTEASYSDVVDTSQVCEHATHHVQPHSPIAAEQLPAPKMSCTSDPPLHESFCRQHYSAVSVAPDAGLLESRQRKQALETPGQLVLPGQFLALRQQEHSGLASPCLSRMPPDLGSPVVASPSSHVYDAAPHEAPSAVARAPSSAASAAQGRSPG